MIWSMHPYPLPPQPPACQELIKKLLTATDEEMAEELKMVESWSFGKVSPPCFSPTSRATLPSHSGQACSVWQGDRVLVVVHNLEC